MSRQENGLLRLYACKYCSLLSTHFLLLVLFMAEVIFHRCKTMLRSSPCCAVRCISMWKKEIKVKPGTAGVSVFRRGKSHLEGPPAGQLNGPPNGQPVRHHSRFCEFSALLHFCIHNVQQFSNSMRGSGFCKDVIKCCSDFFRFSQTFRDFDEIDITNASHFLRKLSNFTEMYRKFAKKICLKTATFTFGKC